MCCGCHACHRGGFTLGLRGRRWPAGGGARTRTLSSPGRPAPGAGWRLSGRDARLPALPQRGEMRRRSGEARPGFRVAVAGGRAPGRAGGRAGWPGCRPLSLGRSMDGGRDCRTLSGTPGSGGGNQAPGSEARGGVLRWPCPGMERGPGATSSCGVGVPRGRGGRPWSWAGGWGGVWAGAAGRHVLLSSAPVLPASGDEGQEDCYEIWARELTGGHPVSQAGGCCQAGGQVERGASPGPAPLVPEPPPRLTQQRAWAVGPRVSLGPGGRDPGLRAPQLLLVGLGARGPRGRLPRVRGHGQPGPPDVEASRA